MEKKRIPIMLNGIPGNMASLVEAALWESSEFEIIPISLTGPDMGQQSNGEKGIKDLFEPSRHEHAIEEVARSWGSNGIIVIDFTQPSGVENNARLYCKNNLPFIMGTTGGNRDALTDLVTASKTSAIIATNMSAPIVMLMDMIMFAADNYPGVLKNWEIRIVESHQSTKKDVSGTALNIGKIMQGLGVNFTGLENIRIVRDQIEQRLMGIPEFAIGGHGWHEYSLISPDGNVVLGFKHNINGRDTYVNGTLMALSFLKNKISEGIEGKCFSMKDVMRG